MFRSGHVGCGADLKDHNPILLSEAGFATESINDDVRLSRVSLIITVPRWRRFLPRTLVSLLLPLLSIAVRQPPLCDCTRAQAPVRPRICPCEWRNHSLESQASAGGWQQAARVRACIGMLSTLLPLSSCDMLSAPGDLGDRVL